MTTIKVGTIVRYIHNDDEGLYGQTGTVIEEQGKFGDMGRFIPIRFNKRIKGCILWYVHNRHIEIIDLKYYIKQANKKEEV